MRALALKSVTDGDPARKSQKAPIQPLPISPWFTPASVSNGPLFQRKPSCACGGGCPQCQQQSGHVDLQTKLAVSEPGDQYEKEAERVSERILRMPDSSRHAQPGPASMASTIRRLSVPEVSAAGNAAGIQLNRGGGHPLSPSTRQFME